MGNILNPHVMERLAMEQFDELISVLPERHQSALRWFAERTGSEQPWPETLPDGTLLASRAKGIYKPNWMKYALSVRQALRGPYSDREPAVHADGTWTYHYFQENQNPLDRNSAYTNIGLVECMNDRVPVGVMRQVKEKPNPRYQVLGVALVTGWEQGYFFLEGFSRQGFIRESANRPKTEMLILSQQEAAEDDGSFLPGSITDARDRIIASIVRRRGQPEFRHVLLEAYGKRCAITDCNAEDALEAAHIVPYNGTETNIPSNGLLLRSDIHTLFDLGLLVVDTSDMTVLVSPILAATVYHSLAGKSLRVPKDPRLAPNIKALDNHRSWAGL